MWCSWVVLEEFPHTLLEVLVLGSVQERVNATVDEDGYNAELIEPASQADTERPNVEQQEVDLHVEEITMDIAYVGN